MKTQIGNNEKRMLSEIEEVIERWTGRLNKNKEEIKSDLGYLWKKQKDDSNESWQEYMSAHDIGPYGGR